MAIQINPGRVQVPSGSSGKSSSRRRQAGVHGDVIVPNRADVNYIPGPESLQTLISSAVEALRRGRSWDRGTILNLLV